MLSSHVVWIIYPSFSRLLRSLVYRYSHFFGLFIESLSQKSYHKRNVRRQFKMWQFCTCFFSKKRLLNQIFGKMEGKVRKTSLAPKIRPWLFRSQSTSKVYDFGSGVVVWRRKLDLNTLFCMNSKLQLFYLFKGIIYHCNLLHRQRRNHEPSLRIRSDGFSQQGSDPSLSSLPPSVLWVRRRVKKRERERASFLFRRQTHSVPPPPILIRRPS